MIPDSNFANVEQAANHPDYFAAALFHDVEGVALFVGDGPRNTFQKELGSSMDSGHRGSEFMRHVRQELGLHVIEGL